MNRKEATMCPYFVRIKTKSSYSRKFTGVLRIFLDPFMFQYILLSFGTTLKFKKKNQGSKTIPCRRWASFGNTQPLACMFRLQNFIVFAFEAI